MVNINQGYLHRPPPPVLVDLFAQLSYLTDPDLSIYYGLGRRHYTLRLEASLDWFDRHQLYLSKWKFLFQYYMASTQTCCIFFKTKSFEKLKAVVAALFPN